MSCNPIEKVANCQKKNTETSQTVMITE